MEGDKVSYWGEIMDRNLIDLYYDHYKESFALSKSEQKQRNKNFVLLCLLEGLLYLISVRPEVALELVDLGIQSQFNKTFEISLDLLQTLDWLFICYVMIRYCQNTLYIERMYHYLSNLEDFISKESGTDIFQREGANYLKDYPIVLNLIDLFYKMVCPVLFEVINLYRIINEWDSKSIHMNLILDTTICIMILIITWFYFFEIHSKISSWCKEHIPFIRVIADKLKKILKEV